MPLPLRHALFLACCLGVALANASVVRRLFDHSMANEAASHVIVIPLVTLALIVRSRQAIFASVGSSWLSGLVTFAAGSGLLAGSRFSPAQGGLVDSLSVAVGGLVVLWVGAFLVCYGQAAFRAALFPLVFLGFTVPVPGALLNAANAFLQRGSAEVTALLFTLTGTPVHREGYVFTLPDLVIMVAEQCSGIRSTIALFLTALLAGHMALRTAWSKAMVAVAMVAITILKNGIRIVSLSLLAMHVDPAFLAGRLHRQGGIVFFLLALAMLSPVVAWLARAERAAARPPAAGDGHPIELTRA